MKPADEQYRGTCQDTVRSPNVTVNHLPDEVLLGIFDSYRQGTNPYDYWDKYLWFNLAHVCRRWRAIMFASPSRLDLGITVGPEKPGHIKTILSGRLPIFIDYNCRYKEITGRALWRMRAALKHRDRVRRIVFKGTSAWFDEFFKATNCPFPVLESLLLCPKYRDTVKLPDTFLGRPDIPYLHLRCLTLHCFSLSSISRILLSATALTNLSLSFNIASSPSPGTTLLACLQGIPCLCSLSLTISSKSPWQALTPKYIVPLPKLTYLNYDGCSVLLDALVSGLSAPSLRDVAIYFTFGVPRPIVHLPRFISEIEEHYHVVRVTLGYVFHLSLLNNSEYINHCWAPFNLGLITRDSPGSIIPLSTTLSMRLATVEELCIITFERTDASVWENFVPWRRFYQQFPGVKALRTKGIDNYYIARTLVQGHEDPNVDLPFFPALKEIELGKNPLLTHEGERGRELAAFQPFVSARQQAGHPVKVFFST